MADEPETEKFWGPISAVCVADFADLRLAPPLIDHEADQMVILDRRLSPLARLTRAGVSHSSQPPAHVVIEVARAVAAKVL